MANKDTKAEQPATNINLPANVPILYTDSVFISSNEFGIVINIGQQLDDQNQQIVARFGMSREHAKKLSEVLAQHIAITTSRPDKQ